MVTIVPNPVLITRAQPECSQTVRRLRRLGWHAMAAPLLEISPQSPIFPKIDCAIFTSTQAVRYAPAGQGRIAHVVGKATARLAIRHGWDVTMPPSATVAALRTHLIETRPQSRCCWLRGQDVTEPLDRLLTEAGLSCDSVVVYSAKQVPDWPKAFQKLWQNPHAATLFFFSTRAAENFHRLGINSDLTSRLSCVMAVCMSPRIAEALQDLPLGQVIVASAPDMHGMILALQSHPPCNAV